MAFRQASHLPGALERHRRLVPVGVVVLVYFVAGILWIFGSALVADTIAEITSIPRWIMELGKSVLFVTITALVLWALMRHRADRLDAAGARRHRDADRLAASEHRNRLQATALEGTAYAVMITGRDGTIEWVNEAFETMSGYPSSSAVGATPRLLKSGVQDDEFYRDMWETILAGQAWSGQVVNRRKDGELYTASQTITPVVAEGGETQNFVAIQEDISERVLVARTLEESHLRLQSLFDHALDAVVLADGQDRYIEVNPAFCELTGYSRVELLDMGPADLAVPDQHPVDVANQFDAFVHAGAESGTFSLRHKDGHVIETEYRAVSNIQPGVHLSVLRDVTARNRMLGALTLAEAEFRELAENGVDIVATLRVDDDGRMHIDYVNAAATTILGYTQEHLYTAPDLLLDLFRQRSDDLDDALDLLPTPAEPARAATVQVHRADGPLVWLEIRTTLIDPSTLPVTVQLLARDVTARLEMTQALEQALHDELEAAEKLLTLNAMKDTFLQNLSHEMRTPLTVILGFAQLLADSRHGLSPRETRELYERIFSNAQRLQRLLDDLLDLDRFTRGHIEPNRLPTELAGLIERVVQDIDLGDHVIELDLEPLTMDLDAPRVERMIANLLRNVVRHTPPDTRVWIRTQATTEGVEITVDDDGPGIPEGDRKHVIEPFRQGTKAASSAQPGTGVGLPLVNTFAQIHRGQLVITESPAGGTRATVTLAHAQPDSQEEASDASADAAVGL